MLNEHLSQVVRRWVYRVRSTGTPAARRPALRVEECEARLAPAVLPAVTVEPGSAKSVAGGYSPSAVYNPGDPNQGVLTTTDGTNVFVYFTTNGGQDWTLGYDTVKRPTFQAGDPAWRSASGGRMVDPTLDPSKSTEDNRVYPVNDSPSAGIGRDGSVFVASRQATADGSGGVVSVHKFQFVPGANGLSFTAVDQDTGGFGGLYGSANLASLAYRWVGADPAFNPVVAVNNNIPAFTDPDTGYLQADSMVDPTTQAADTVYVAWNSDATAPSVNNQGFVRNIIISSASADGGRTFSNPLLVNPSYFTGTGGVAPQIVFAPAGSDRNGEAAGRMVFVWNGQNTANGTNAGRVLTDRSGPVVAGGSGLAVAIPAFTGAPVPARAQVPIFVSPTSANSLVGDVSVEVSLTHTDVGRLNLYLVSPSGARVQLAAAGSATGGSMTGTQFNDRASRSLATGPAPYSATFRPLQPLSAFANTAARGFWTVEVEDTVPGGAGVVTAAFLTVSPTAPQVAEFTSSGGFIFDAGAPVNSSPSFPVTTEFPLTVNITDPNFGALTDLDVSVAMTHANRNQVRIELFAPGSTTGILLVNNLTQADGKDRQTVGGSTPGLPAGANMGSQFGNVTGDSSVRTVFDAEAPRPINDRVNDGRYIGHFRPEGGAFGLQNLYGRLPSDPNDPTNQNILNGTWRLRVTDFVNSGTNPVPLQFIDSFSLKFTAGQANGFGFDSIGFQGALAAGVNQTNPGLTNLVPNTGVGPGVSVAYDTSLGSFSPFRGRMYAAYTGGGANDGADVFLRYSDDNGLSWSIPVRVNDDSRFDNFSEGDRPQFMPTVAVDPVTGTVVVMFYDARDDASEGRAATYIATSIDGGDTFSIRDETQDDETPSNQTFVNAPKQAVDAYTGKTVTLEPVPTNLQLSGANGVGFRNSLWAYGGKITPFWTGNANAGGVSVFTADVVTAAGPRIVESDTGPVVDDQLAGGVAYNDTFAADGTRQVSGFRVRFDRAIDPSTFNVEDVTVQFMDTAGNKSAVAVGAIVAADDFTGPADSTYVVRFAQPQSGVGTYSYSIGPNIRDRIRNPVGVTFNPVLPGFAEGYQPATGLLPRPIADGTAAGSVVTSVPITVPALPNGQVVGEVSVEISLTHTRVGDIQISLRAPDGTTVILAPRAGLASGNGLVYFADNYTDTRFDDAAATSITAGTPPFTGTFRPLQPLSRFKGLQAGGQWELRVEDFATGEVGTVEQFVLNLTPGRVNTPTDPAPGNWMDQNANARPLERPGVASGTNDVYAVPRPTSPTPVPFQSPFASDSLPLIVPGPRVLTTAAVGISPSGQLVNSTGGDNLVLNAGATGIDITFDRDMNPATFTADDVIRLTGPAGVIEAVPGFPFKVTPLSARTFRVEFPDQNPSTPAVDGLTVSGPYSIEFGPNIFSTTGLALDTNANAGVNVLRRDAPAGTALTTRTYLTAPSGSTADDVPVPAGGTRNGATDTATASITLDVADDFIITQDALNRILVRLTIDGTPVGGEQPDFQGVLIAPDGTRVRLFKRYLAQGPLSSFRNTLFDDAALNAPIQNGAAPFDLGAYSPVQPLSDLVGKSTRGTWRLEVTNTGGGTGVIRQLSLTLPFAVPISGLGEAVADRFQVGFRVFIQDPTHDSATTQWTPVGPAPGSGLQRDATTQPAAVNTGSNAGPVSAVAIDPSDPSGNTVFAAAASGGLWKTTNFLTADAAGPTWVPLTDSGPTYSLNVQSITVIPRNNDPAQSIVFALTGQGSFSQNADRATGVGVLRSMDGGKTWAVLDSTQNALNGAILPIDSPARDRQFFGAVGYKVAVDPTPLPGGEYLVYIAVKNAVDPTLPGADAGGLWRSTDTGKTWTRVRAGQATDVVLGSAPNTANRNRGYLYAGFEGEGVFFTDQAPNAAGLLPLAGNQGNNLIRDINVPGPSIAVTVDPPDGDAAGPNGAKGRISLAVPALTNDPLRDSLYAGWVYAFVSTAGGTTAGVYQSKDFGRNWTRVQLSAYTPNGVLTNLGSNNDSNREYDVLDGFVTVGDRTLSITVDPNDPNVIYLGGYRTLRVDTTRTNDAHAFTFFDNTAAGQANQPQSATTGGAIGRPGTDAQGNPVGNPRGQLYEAGSDTTQYATDFLNLQRDPDNPFLSNATLRVSRTLRFENDGANTRWMDATNLFADSGDEYTQLVAVRDPLTGLTRLIGAAGQGVFSGVDDGNGVRVAAIGFATDPGVNRNGNLQIAQLFSGAAQPSQLAADLAGAMFYGMSFGAGFPVTSPDIIATGNIEGQNTPFSPFGVGTGVATDPTGTGSAYQYRLPGGIDGRSFDLPTDFFRVFGPGGAAAGTGTGSDHRDTGISRTNGLIQAGDNPGLNAGQWALADTTYGYFAVNAQKANPTDPMAMLLGSRAGRIFRTVDEGRNWFPVAEPANVGSSYAKALAFGAPDPSTPGEVNNFLMAGTLSGRFFYTLTGGAPWREVSTGLDGSGIEQIVPSPVRGSRAAFLVTLQGVYYNADVTAANSVWSNITGNLRTLRKPILGDANNQFTPATGDLAYALGDLHTIAVDWRYSIPTNPGSPGSPTFPVLYVGGEGGVFRTLSAGSAWDFFPSTADGAVVAGGYMPDADVRDLDLALGNINPTTGLPEQAGGLNLLLATTYGRGQFVIRLDTDNATTASGVKVGTYNTQFQSGPRVVVAADTTPAFSNTVITVTFDSPVDAASFGVDDVRITADDGTVLPVASVQPVPVPAGTIATRTSFLVTLGGTGPVAEGRYTIAIGPDVTGLGGYRMNQNANLVNGEPGDQFVSSILLNTPGVSGSLVVGMEQIVTAGDGTATVVITVLNPDGTVNTGFAGTVLLTTSDPTAMVPAQYTFAGTEGGRKTLPVTFRRAGPQSITANPSGSALNSGTGFTQVRAAAATGFVLSGVPASVAAGNVVGMSLTAVDPFGNVDTGYIGTVSVVSSDPLVPVQSHTFLSSEQGTFRFDVTPKTAGTQTVTFTDVTDQALTTTATLTVTPGLLAGFGLSGFPSPVLAGTPGTFTVVARDAFGNQVTNYTGTVRFTSTDAAAVLPQPGPLVNGTGTFTATLNSAGVRDISAIDTVTNVIGTHPVITVTPVPPPPPNTAPTISTLPDVVVQSGSLSQAFAFTVGDAQTPADQLVVTAKSSNTAVVPLDGIIIEGTGANRTVRIRPLSGVNRSANITLTVTDAGGLVDTDTFVVRASTSAPPPPPEVVPPTVPAVPPTVPVVPPTTVPPVGPPTNDQGQPVPPPATPVPATPANLPKAFSVGTDAGTAAAVTVYDQQGNRTNSFEAFEPDYTGGVRVATGRNVDGVIVLSAAGTNRPPDVRITNLTTGRVDSLLAFESTFTGGVFVSVGDFDRDGYDDYVMSADQGGGPRVKIVSGRTGDVMVDFYGIDDSNFRGGARTAVGDVNGDGTPDLVVAAGFGGGPRIAVFDGKTVATGFPNRLTSDFFAFEERLRNGAFVAVGDVNGDGLAELIAGAGPGGGPRVQVFDGAALIGGQVQPIANFFLGNPDNRGGVRVAVTNLDNDNRADVVVGSGVGGGSRVTAYPGTTLATGDTTPAFEFDVLDGFDGGVFVG